MEDTTFGNINAMKRTNNYTDFSKLNGEELLDLIDTDFHSGTAEKLATVKLQLETATKCDTNDEEGEFALEAIKKIHIKFQEHIGKEKRLLFPLLPVTRRKKSSLKEGNEVPAFIAEL